MPQGTIDSIVGGLSGGDKKDFDDHLEYRSLENQRKMKREDFEGFKGGTEDLFEKVYRTCKRELADNDLFGKTDEKSVRQALEIVILQSLDLTGSDSKVAADIYKSIEKAGEFDSESAKITYLQQKAMEHLGVSREDLGRLHVAFKGGVKEDIYGALENFKDNLKEGIIGHRINKHKEKTASGREDKFTAYVVNKLKDHGAEPEKYGETYLKGLDANLGVIDQLKGRDVRDNEFYKSRGLKPYEAKK